MTATRRLLFSVVTLLIALAIFPIEISFVISAYDTTGLSTYFSTTQQLFTLIPLVITVGLILGSLYTGYSAFKEAGSGRD